MLKNTDSGIFEGLFEGSGEGRLSLDLGALSLSLSLYI